MRKGNCTANARPLFFENGLLHCKLTVASAIQKGLLHVSFGAVRSRCRCALKKAFSLSDNFAGAVKAVLFRKPKVFYLQKALRFALKSLSFSQPKHRLFEQLFTVRKNRLFMCKKTFFCTNLFLLLSKASIFTNQKPFFRTNLSLFPPKAILFHPPLPIPTTLNLLSAKNTAVLLLFALILCCKAGTSHRFKSLPAISGKLLFSALPVT